MSAATITLWIATLLVALVLEIALKVFSRPELEHRVMIAFSGVAVIVGFVTFLFTDMELLDCLRYEGLLLFIGAIRLYLVKKEKRTEKA